MLRLFVCLLFFCSAGLSAQDIPYKSLVPQRRQALSEVHFSLESPVWNWLREKKSLVVATWDPLGPPFDVVLRGNAYEGINSDYLQLISQQLGLPVTVRRYQTRELALQALAGQQVDMIVDDPGTPATSPQSFNETDSYIANVPALVRNEVAGNAPDRNRPFSLAVAENYLSDAEIKQLYPHAIIYRYASNVSAMAAVVFGERDYMLGNMATVSFLIDYNYNNLLKVEAVSPTVIPGGRFILRKSDPLLLTALNRVIGGISPLQKDAILNFWLLGADFSVINQSSILSEEDKLWIQAHPVIRVMASPFYPPLTLQDEKGQFHGVSADLLHLIALRTGLNFEFVEYKTYNTMLDALASGKADMFASLSYSPARGQQLAFSRTWLFTTYVLVVKNRPDAPTGIRDGMHIATSPDAAPVAELKKKFPHITWTEVPSAVMALKMVDEGKVDAAIHNLTGARFIMNRYFSGRLRVTSRVSEQPADFAFAFRRGDRELEDIFNKALSDIPVRAYVKVLNKWQGVPEVPLQTWRLYTTQYLIAFALAGLLLMVVLLWGVSLRVSVRKRQKAQLALQEQLIFSHSLIEGSPLPVYVIDPEGNILTANRAWHRFFQNQGTAESGNNLFDRRHPLSDVFFTLLPLLNMNAEEECRSEQQISNGCEIRTVSHWAVRLMSETGSVRGAICGWEDITEQQALLRALETEKDIAVRAGTAKSNFLATMSHEIRTPVSAIISLLELAKNTRLAPTPDGEAVRLAYGSARTLLELIGDVLDMAKIEAGKLELEPQWISPAALAESVKGVFSGLAQQKGLILTAETTVASDTEIYIDAQRLRQVLFNYVSNAIKFTTEGSVSLLLNTCADVDNKAFLHVTIADTGSGISDAEQLELFHPFSQLAAGRKQTGSGLGLVISAEILAKMQGDFKLDSMPGKGTRIMLRIPTEIRQGHLRADSAPDVSASAPYADLQGMRVLIVDDHPTNRLVLRRQLENLNACVTEAVGGKNALQQLDCNTYTLIITDVRMPEMDGVMLSQEIRKRGYPVAIWGLTADAQPEERQRCLDAGMDACFFKPLSAKTLWQAVINDLRQEAEKPHLSAIIDLTNLRRIAQNNDAYVIQMLQETLQENRKDLQNLQQAIVEEDMNAVEEILHRLSGVAQILDAKRLSASIEIARQRAGSGQSLEGVTKPGGELFDALTELVEAVEAYPG